MSLVQSQRMLVGQRMAHQMCLANIELLDIPISGIEKVLRKVLDDPSLVESKLDQSTSGKGSGVSYHYSRLTSSLLDKGEIESSDVEHSGVFIGGLEAEIDKEALGQPDLTYVVKGYGNFSIEPWEHFKPTPIGGRLLQLPPKAKSYAGWLVTQKNWMVRTAEEGYRRIGKRQAGFLFRLNPLELLELIKTNLSEELDLPYSYSVYYRLLKNRSVQISSPNGEAILPISLLMPTRNQVITYQRLPNLNELIKQEFISGSALGDGKLVYILKKDFNCVVPTRTFTKYRELADIPDRSVRQSEYNSGRTEPFRFATLIEAYLQK